VFGQKTTNWLNTQETIKACKYVILTLCVFNIITLLILVHESNKPPFVIRVEPHGESALVLANSPKAYPEQQEAVFFTEKFLDKLLAYNHETLEDDLSIALSYMTPTLKQEHIDSWKETGSLDKIKRAKFSTRLYFDKVVANQDEYGDFIVHFRFASETTREGKKEALIPFQGFVTLRATQRDMNNVYGLIVTNINVEEA